jgi:uncharacterized protein involved in copper resistance
VRKSVVVMIIVSTVLALSIGTALAENKPADKGDGKGQEKQAANKSTAAKGQEKQVANKGITKNKATDKGGDKEQNQGTSYAFKGTIAQNGTDGSPLEVKVEKANDVAQSFVGKNLKFAVSSDTEIYLDNADVESSKLDAKLPDLKAGDKVVIQAKAPENASSFTASLISAEASNTEGANTEGKT